MLAKLLKALNAEGSPSQISGAFILGMILAFTPVATPHNLLILFLALVLRVNLTAFLLSWGVLTGLAYLLDPLFIDFGEYLLTQPALQEFWRSLYVVDAWRVTQFNNTLVLGSLVVSLLLAIPAFFIMNFSIRQYRARILAVILKSKIMSVLQASKFYRIYNTLIEGV